MGGLVGSVRIDTADPDDPADVFLERYLPEKEDVPDPRAPRTATVRPAAAPVGDCSWKNRSAAGPISTWVNPAVMPIRGFTNRPS